MATILQILRCLSSSQAKSRKDLESQLGQSYRTFQTQLDRLCKTGTIQDIGDHYYLLTEPGNDRLMEFEVTSYNPPRFSIIISENDLARLDDSEFEQAWHLIGHVIRNQYRNPVGKDVNRKEKA